MIFTSGSLHSCRISTWKHPSSWKQLLRLIKQSQIPNFNKITFVIYRSILCWLFPQSLQYRLKALVNRFFYIASHFNKCIYEMKGHMTEVETIKRLFSMKLWCSSENPNNSKNRTSAPFQQFSYRPTSLLQVSWATKRLQVI